MYEKAHILFMLYQIITQLKTKNRTLYIPYLTNEKFWSNFGSNTNSRINKQQRYNDMTDSLLMFMVYIRDKKEKFKNICHLQDLDVNFVVMNQFYSFLYR